MKKLNLTNKQKKITGWVMSFLLLQAIALSAVFISWHTTPEENLFNVYMYINGIVLIPVIFVLVFVYAFNLITCDVNKEKAESEKYTTQMEQFCKDLDNLNFSLGITSKYLANKGEIEAHNMVNTVMKDISSIIKSKRI